MDEEKSGTPLVSRYLSWFGTIFTLTLIVMSAAGFLVGRYIEEARELSSLFRLGGEGLPYTAILQIGGFALIMAAFHTFIFSDGPLKKVMVLWKIIILLFLTLVTASIFALVFEWFPLDNREAWFGFVLPTVICFAAGSALMILITRLEGKKYDKLLSEYRTRHHP
jgi:MFS family permease